MNDINKEAVDALSDSILSAIYEYNKKNKNKEISIILSANPPTNQKVGDIWLKITSVKEEN